MCYARNEMWQTTHNGKIKSNQKVIRTLGEKETYKYLGYWKLTPSNNAKWKKKNKKEYLRRGRKLFVAKPFLKWTRRKLNQMDPRTRKLITMHKALLPRDGVVRLYVSRREGGRGLTSIEYGMETSIQRIEDYIESEEEVWLQAPETILKARGPV